MFVSVNPFWFVLLKGTPTGKPTSFFLGGGPKKHTHTLLSHDVWSLRMCLRIHAMHACQIQIKQHNTAPADSLPEKCFSPAMRILCLLDWKVSCHSDRVLDTTREPADFHWKSTYPSCFLFFSPLVEMYATKSAVPHLCKNNTLPPTNVAPAGRYLADQFPLKGTPVRCYVSGREGESRVARSPPNPPKNTKTLCKTSPQFPKSNEIAAKKIPPNPEPHGLGILVRELLHQELVESCQLWQLPERPPATPLGDCRGFSMWGGLTIKHGGGKPQVLKSMCSLTRVPIWYRFFEPQPCTIRILRSSAWEKGD